MIVIHRIKKAIAPYISNKMAIGVLCILFLSSDFVMEGTITSESSSMLAIECYDDTLAPACPTGHQIAIVSYHDGFKPASEMCPLDGTATGSCCTYNAGTDCIQENPTESRYADAFSGRSDGTTSTSSVSPTTGGSCDSMTYSAASVFSRLTFLCIPSSRAADMCVINSFPISGGLPVYVQNRGYSSGTSIISSDTSCDCSVEAAVTSSSMKLYVIQEDLYDNTGNCLQSLTISDGSSAIKTIQCADPTFNTISEETISTNFVIISLMNSYTSNAGKFWIGFEGSTANTDIYVSCPAASRIDCGSLTNPDNGAVSFTCSGFGCTATYTCTNSLITGDLTRTCQSDGSWSGMAAQCASSCTTDADCSANEVCSGGICTSTDNGSPSSSSGSLSGGAIAGIAIGAVLGAALVVVVVAVIIYRYKESVGKEIQVPNAPREDHIPIPGRV